jgi:DNA repair protein RadC
MVPSMGDCQRPLTPLQRRFVKSGLKGLEEPEIVELLLSLSLPCSVCPMQPLSPACQDCRKQNELVLEKLRTFNSRQLLSALPLELHQICDSPYMEFLIKLLQELPSEILKQRITEHSVHSSSKEVFDYLYYSMRDLKKELFKVIFLDNRSRIIDIADLFEGTRDGVPIRPREIEESAIRHNASALIFVHNHPSGNPKPTKIDKQITRDLVFAGMILLIKVLDHIIIGENKYFSFADEGLIEKYEDEFLNLRIKAISAIRVPVSTESKMSGSLTNPLHWKVAEISR